MFLIYWMYFMCPFKNRIYKYFNINFLKTKKVTKWVLKVHMSRKQVRVNQQIHLCQVVLIPQSLTLSMYLFPNYNYYFRYYVVGGYYFYYYYYENFSKSSFASLVILDQLINLFFLCMLYTFSLGMNQHELYFTTSSYDATTT